MGDEEIGCEFRLHSLTDSHPYNLPDELFFGQLKSSTEYEKGPFIDDGAYSQVYHAKDKRNAEFALKILKPTRGGPGLANEVFREITILKSLDHENIIKLHECIVGSFPDNPSPRSICLVLDYCPKNLSQFIDEFKTMCPHDQVKNIARQVLRGLDYLHKNYIIHRDICPRNIVISKDNKWVKIIDFGLSERVMYPEGVTSPALINRWYRAPELLWEAPTYDFVVDIWSVACIMVEMCGKRPFLAGTSDIHQMQEIIAVFGTPTPKVWPDFEKCRRAREYKPQDLILRNLCDSLDSMNAVGLIDLLEIMFVYDPKVRATAETCVNHWMFIQSPLPSESICEDPANSGF